MTDIVTSDWAELDANNTSPQPNGVQTGYSPSSIAGIIRAIRGGVKRAYVQANALVTTTGTGSAYLLTYGAAPAAYAKGVVLRFYAHADNLGACTLNINSLGVKSILSRHGVALSAGQIKANQLVELAYNGTSFVLITSEIHDSKFTGNTSFSGGIDVTGNATLNANTTIGNANTDLLTINAKLNSSIVPNGNNTIFLGSAANQFKAHISQLAGDVSANGNIFLETAGVTRGGIVQDNANDRLILRKSSNTGVTQAELRIDGSAVTDLKFLGNTVWHAGNDGAGTGLDADLLDGQSSAFYLAASAYTAADVLTKIKTVDGAGSGLDADLLDGQSSAYFQDLANSTGTLPNARLTGIYDFTALTLTGTGEALKIISSNDTSDPFLSFHKATTGRQAYIQHQDGTGDGTGFNFANDVSGQKLVLNNAGGSNAFRFYDGTTMNAVWHSGNDGAGSGLDADTLDGLSSGSFYRTNASHSTTGNLTITNAAPEIKFIDNTASAYSARLRVDGNNVYFDSSTDDITFGEVFRFELDTKIGYVNNSRIPTAAAGTAYDSSRLGGVVASSYALDADLTSGLALKANLASPALTGTPTAPTQAAGNSSTRLATTAFVQGEITSSLVGYAQFSTTTSATTTSFPIGHLIAVYSDNAIAINATVTPSLRTDVNWLYTLSGQSLAGSALAGTWRSRGTTSGNGNGYYLMQRVS